jgi:hypothetical protein
MTNDLDHYENLSLQELSKVLKNLILSEDDYKRTMSITSVLGLYIEKLQEEYDYSPIFPLELLPIPKNDIKKWGVEYALQVIRKEGKLKQYQQDGALCYTRFRSMTTNQWDAIKTGSIDGLILYNAELRDKGFSAIEIPEEFKVIIGTFQEDYKVDVIELHNYLRSSKSSSKGCLFNTLLFYIVGLTLTAGLLLF